MVSLSNKSIRWKEDFFIIFIYEPEPSSHRLVVILYIFINILSYFYYLSIIKFIYTHCIFLSFYFITFCNKKSRKNIRYFSDISCNIPSTFCLLFIFFLKINYFFAAVVSGVLISEGAFVVSPAVSTPALSSVTIAAALSFETTLSLPTDIMK